MLVCVPAPLPRIGVCLVRVEPQPWGVVITVTVNRDVAAGRAEPAVRFSDVGSAVAAVAEFLGSFGDERQS